MDFDFGALDWASIAEAHGTPLYLYDLDGVRAQVGRVRAGLADPALHLLYAAKANPNARLLAGLRGTVEGVDVASEGEVELALHAGWSADRLHFAGPGKSRAALARALEVGVGVVSVESVRELELVVTLARERGIRPRVALRVNPERRLHAFAVPMVGVPSPFGVDAEALSPACEILERSTALLDFEGVHVHGGGQCTSAEGFGAHLQETIALALRVERETGLRARSINFGGGFGVVPGGTRALDLERLGARLAAAWSEVSGRLAGRERPIAKFELGRYLVARHGIYVARVVSKKYSRGKTFVILDGGLNHNFAATGLLAPRAPRLPLVNLSRPEAPSREVTVVGPLCTPLDELGRDLRLPEPEVGDLIGVLESGAYGYTLSPLQFLGHTTPAELVLERGALSVARRRRTALESAVDPEARGA